jgi:N-methylhydantoinase A
VATVEVVFEADMAYDGQTHVVLTTFENADVDHDAIRRTFEETYQRFYGRIIEGFPVTIVNLRTTIEGMRPSFDLRRFLPGAAATLEEARKGERQVYFDGSFMPADIYERNLLPVGVSFTGPAIVEQADATTVIPPSVGARVDDIGNLVLERQT